jgi:acyl-lipid omega-6 desaturase (Delta-12 desaturase)
MTLARHGSGALLRAVRRVRCTALPLASVRGDEPRLRPSNRAGALYLLGAITATGSALWLSAQPAALAWLAGQALLALVLLQWFVLLHEAGHMSLFRSRELNVVAGHVAGFMALIPFAAWRRVHGLHHLWTGWQDRDPTTAALTPRPRGRLECASVDIAWRLWLPLFALVYRLSNYWHVARLSASFSAPRQRLAMQANIVALLIGYAGGVVLLGVEVALKLFGLATLLGLMLQEPLILSQHTHLPQRLSGGRRVAPLAPAVQASYTRSLGFPRWFAQGVLLNFNAHELHHRFAAVPGYRLGRIAWQAPHEVHWWTWLKAVKRMRGSTFLFETREHTGFPL